jgi:hypothetical protein
MEKLPKRVIRAIIPSNERPPRYLLTKADKLPEHEHTYGVGRTFEGTLSRLGHLVTGMALSVDRFVYSRTPDEILYRTKAIPADTNLLDGHIWSDKLPDETG